MSIQLTPEQQLELEGSSEQPIRITNPRTKESYILISETEYESFQEYLEEERQQQAIRRVGRRNAVGRMEENA